MKAITGSSQPLLDGFEQQISAKGEGDMILFPSEGKGRCRVRSCWFIYSLVWPQGRDPHCRDLWATCPAICPQEGSPWARCEQWSALESPGLWSSSGFIQCKGGGHSTLSPSLASARWENSSLEAEDESRAAPKCTTCGGLCLQTGIRQDSSAETGRNCSCSTLW